MVRYGTTTHSDADKTRNTPDALLTVAEVAYRLRVDDTTVRRWIRYGSLQAFTLPHAGKRQSYRVRLSTLNRLLGQP